MLSAAMFIPLVILNHVFVLYKNREKDIDWLLKKRRVRRYYRNMYGEDYIDRIKNSFLVKKHFILPTILIFFIILIGAHFGLHLQTDNLDEHSKCAIYGFLGAYLWGITNIIRRIQGLNLTPKSLYLITAKILIFTAIGYILPYLLIDTLSYVAAFMIGALPISRVSRMIVKLVSRESYVQDNPTSSDDKISSLQGINDTLASRLEDYDIETIQNLAYCNIVDLYLRSNTDGKVILDLIDQALLWVYIGEKARSFRPHGIRGAIELATLGHKLVSKKPSHDKAQANEVIKSLAVVLDIPVTSMMNLIDEVSNDLQVLLVWDIWGEMHNA